MHYKFREQVIMKAINDNIINRNRNKLEDVIPLSTPYTVAIDPSNLCNFKCNFCAIQSKSEKLNFKKQFMDKKLFFKIIDDLTEFPEQLKVLRINGQGEPLLNPDLPEMIQYAKDKHVAEFVEIITNGSRLNPELSKRLIDSGIDRIRISIEALDADGYYDIAGAKINFDNFVNNIKYLHDISGNCEIYCKIVDVAVPTDSDKQKFYNLFGDICDRIFIDNVIPLWSDFEEIKDNMVIGEKGVHGQKVQNVMVCPYSFYSLIVNSDGEVTACCADWKRKLVFGDLNNDKLTDIWRGEKLRNFWIEMLKGNKNSYEMCCKCTLPAFDCNDYIDDYADMILRRVIGEENEIWKTGVSIYRENDRK